MCDRTGIYTSNSQTRSGSQCRLLGLVPDRDVTSFTSSVPGYWCYRKLLCFSMLISYIKYMVILMVDVDGR